LECAKIYTNDYKNADKILTKALKYLHRNNAHRKIFSFADDLHEMKLDEQDILVSYDVSSLFTNVLVDETIDILVEKAFKDDWFNKEYDLNITKTDIIELLEIATKNRHFQFEGNLYEQVDGVAMGSPLGPLMANAFMCNVEGKLKNQNKMLAFYKRCVDDTRSKINVRCFICLYVLVNTE